jgi:PAS domain S-box-containing protein
MAHGGRAYCAAIIASTVRQRASQAAQQWRRSGLIEIVRWLAIAAVYVVAARIGFRAAFVAEQVSPVWPAAGLALWVMLKFGVRAWPAVWVGAVVANLTAHVPVISACAIGAGNTLEAIIGAKILEWFADVEHTVKRLRQVVTLITAALLSTIVSAMIGVATLCLSKLQPWERFGALYSTWWLGDATGILVVAPVLLTLPLWKRGGLDGVGASRDFAVIEATALVVSVLVFARASPTLVGGRLLGYGVFPMVMWAGLRFAHPGAALVNLTISWVAVWGTLHGTGPFSAGSSTANESITLLQIYTAVIASSGLVFGAAIADRNRSERLRETDHLLTAILSQERDLRTAAPRILKAVGEMLEWELGILWQVADDDRTLEYLDSWQRDDRLNHFIVDSRTRRFERGIGLPGQVWATAQPAWIHDVEVDSNFPRSSVAARLGMHAAFAFPILVGATVRGVMEFFTREPRAIDAPALRLMSAAGSHIGQFVERRRAIQDLAESSALTSAIIDAALDCIISIDANGEIVEFNPAAVRTFGFSRDQVLGRELAETIIPARLRSRHRQALRRCVETGEAHILGKRLEMPAQRADGTEFPVELAVTRVVAGARPVFTAHVRDITDRQRIEHERAELLERERSARMEAERANRSKDQFLATVSHELRTPLTAILGWASILQTRGVSPDRLPDIHDRIFRSAKAQAQIVNDLLDVSRMVAGQFQLEWQETDVCDVARLGLETIHSTALAKGVAMDAEIPGAGCVVSGDPARLQQVIWNLLSNAIRFTPAGGAVLLTVQASGSSVVIEVRDTGIGVSAAFLPHLFERFWQADNTSTRAHGGLGLGLALVRHIVELHGGEVEARSEGEGCGSTFVVRLPARVPERTRSDAPDPATTPVDLPDLRAVRVLIVDDDPGARELFTAILEERGAQTVCAESAAEAMERFRSQPVDVILLDIGMPNEDGFALLRRIRAYEAAHGKTETPAIAVTAFAARVDQDKAMQAGFAAHVSKPVLPATILSVVQQSARR